MLSNKPFSCKIIDFTPKNAIPGKINFNKSRKQKRFFVIPVIFCLLFALLSGCTKDNTTAEMMTTAVPDATIIITGSQTDFPSSNSPVLVVHYELTNNTSLPASFGYLCKDVAYQNGTECKIDTRSLATTPNLIYRDIKPGATQKISVGYKLINTTSVVEIEVKAWLGDEVLLRQILTP